ncbi:hypothetical protein BLNAU_12794 [Blattamonas nauphoetae]|uniref:Uncharacterized protein n=1 Tax=Blattamonas nauphoetae TaxID=2049346 RepID=A0ABQ9XL91_9EUKA|nr:hypothetical protein BLNAU_12794 [Blattamonas nauphoetae]
MKVEMSLSVKGDVLSSSQCFSSSLIHLAPTPLITLPPMDFTDPSYFSIMHTTIVHAIDDSNDESPYYWRSALLSDPFNSGMISITITILSKRDAYIAVGLMDYSSGLPKLESVGLNEYGQIKFNTISSRSSERCHSRLEDGDCDDPQRRGILSPANKGGHRQMLNQTRFRASKSFQLSIE